MKKRLSIDRGDLTGEEVLEIFDEIIKEIKEIKIYSANDVNIWRRFKLTIEGAEEKISIALGKLREKNLVFNELTDSSSCIFISKGKESGK